jgi:succinate dehydrogenase / fumarate reductase, iron-sulfur subunit
MRVLLKIKRFNPEKDEKQWWGEYDLDVQPNDQLLDALNHVKWFMDGTLTFRRSCAHGICGSDAMVVNGRNRLACKVLMKDLGKKITVEPIRGLPVIKDLAVDMEPFFAKYRAIKPYLINDEAPPEDHERYQTVADRERFDDTTKCILCACCTTSCPSFWANGEYVGPAAIVQAHRFIFDSRDHDVKERLEIMNDTMGVWRCRTVFNCVECCPRDINITKAIGDVKKAILEGGV